MSLTTPDLGRRTREVRFNPIRSLTPQSLASSLDEFEAGYLRRAVLLWEAIEARDEVLMTAMPKRRKDASRRPWDIIKVDDSPEAERDEQALRFFYNNLTATEATDLNVRGGLRRLVQQMMDAEFYQYTAHEILWQPRRVGSQRLLTAEFRQVPLWLFENRTGKLRYTGPEGLIDGQPLADDAWLIHTGDGLMRALSVCRMFKQFSLQDWLNFSEKFGTPGIHGETSAAKGTPEWDAFVTNLSAFSRDYIIATSQGAKINLIEAGKTGDAPFEPMVERMSRAMIALCRGSDLGTLSSQDGAGASLQGDETDLLLEDDCANISETLNTTVDRFVLRWLNGRDHESRAYFKLLPPVQQDTKGDIEVDRHLVEIGGSLDAAETYERYGRTLPEGMDNKILLKKSGPPPGELSPSVADPARPGASALPGGADPAAAANDLAAGLGLPATWLEPVADIYRDLITSLESEDATPADIERFLQQAADRLPEIFEEMDIAALADVLEQAMATETLTGARAGLTKIRQAKAA